MAIHDIRGNLGQEASQASGKGELCRAPQVAPEEVVRPGEHVAPKPWAGVNRNLAVVKTGMRVRTGEYGNDFRLNLFGVQFIRQGGDEILDAPPLRGRQNEYYFHERETFSFSGGND